MDRTYRLAISLVLIISAAVLLYGAPQSEAPLPTSVPDLQNAKVIEIKDAAGLVLLSGAFAISQEDDDDDGDDDADDDNDADDDADDDDDADEIELNASLRNSTSADSRATGTAEIEIERVRNGANQELELRAVNLAAGVTLKVWLDGTEIATITTNQRGRAELRLRNRRPVS